MYVVLFAVHLQAIGFRFGAEQAEYRGDLFGISEVFEESLHPTIADGRKEIFQVHVDHQGLPYVGQRIAQNAAAGHKSVRLVRDGNFVQNILQRPVLRGFEQGHGRGYLPKFAVPFGQLKLLVVAGGGDFPIVSQPAQLSDGEAHGSGDLSDGLEIRQSVGREPVGVVLLILQPNTDFLPEVGDVVRLFFFPGSGARLPVGFAAFFGFLAAQFGLAHALFAHFS